MTIALLAIAYLILLVLHWRQRATNRYLNSLTAAIIHDLNWERLCRLNGDRDLRGNVRNEMIERDGLLQAQLDELKPRKPSTHFLN